MLLQFYFSNYKSFENEEILDMRASGSNELSSHIRTILGQNILPISAIYGANASGKSSIVEAFGYMSYYVLNSLGFYNEKNNISEFLSPRSFKFSDKKNEASEFEVSFTDNKKIYYYGFKVDNEQVIEEYLLYNTKTGIKTKKEDIKIFHRKKKELDLISTLEKYRKNLEISLKKETLLVSLGSALNIKELKIVKDWFLNLEILDFSDSLYGVIFESTLPLHIEEQKVKKQLVQFLNSFDNSIIDIEVEKSIDYNKDKQKYTIFTVHKCKDGTKSRMLLSEESSGTKKMFFLYQILKNTLDNGSVFFADELDIKLHPLLMRNIILTFSDEEKNPNNAQLIFTTHNTIYMDMGLLRRDEIWFIEKNNGVSELYSLDDIRNENGEKIRKDNNYEKNYLLGNYGAIPSLKNLF